MTKIGLLVCVFMLAAMINFTQADNPVLCKLHQITGEWEFVFDTDYVVRGDIDRFGSEAEYYDRLSCGRGQPVTLVNFNSDEEDAQLRLIAEIQHGVGADADEAQVERARFNLDNEGHITQLDTSGHYEGEYTMVVHEGIQGFTRAQLDFYDGMIVFDNFWRYNQVEEDVYESVCYETMVGWYHTMPTPDDNNQDELWGCYYAYKTNPTDEDLDESTHTTFNDGYPELESENDQESRECQNEVNELAREGQYTWIPDGSVEVAADSHSLAASSPTAGRTSTSSIESSVNYDSEGQLNQLNALGLRQFIGLDPDCIHETDLPTDFSWNDINGYSFFPEIRNQECGDCFLVASQNVIESRLNIMSNGHLRTSISNQHQKDCNFYIEGCGGGLPINVAKWGVEFGYMDAQCYPEGNNNGRPSAGEFENAYECDLDMVHSCEDSGMAYHVDDYYYVGDNYGGVNELRLMKEVLSHGPVTVVTEVPSYLGSYDTGIIVNECPTPSSEISEYLSSGYDSYRLQMRVVNSNQYRHQINTKTLWERGIEWEMVNHSVVLVGWGITQDPDEIQALQDLVDDECPAARDGAFWIIANSWGTDFGEEGFFRIRRGCDDFAIESQALSIIMQMDDDLIDPTYLSNSQQTCPEQYD